MNSIIFCEGRVDAVLIGQYLVANREWAYSREFKENLKLNPEDKKQLINAYKRDNDWVYIWAVGGRNRFQTPIQKVLTLNQKADNESGFRNYIILVDNDGGEQSEIQTEFCNCFHITRLRNNEWEDFHYVNGFGEDSTARILLTIIPFDEPGALETVMINSLAEKDDENIVPRCLEFVDGIQTRKYLLNRREKLKAKLSTIVSIISPDRAVDSLVEIIEGIEWNKYNSVNRAFNKLLEL
ncbi:hypothetical protein EDC14_101391 [Hydrogenispora ethanolica]|jgi:hypothetical protein|uniref:Uncharacterized protein n=1 Tax=Hydrogenispora ethanolica TaxID=1082276 RepID=A0A4R1RRA0_HYDET|nr:DUF3226 domain-containing protein [Hydrogenispora ethanolica]TCL68550.1 hypothetical protein EDC14_101391 [Hydrogenispora ethanolica]